MNKQYRRPPLVEAVCDLHFAPSRPWDATEPGLLFGAIRDEYPIRKSTVSLSQTVTEIEPGGIDYRVTPVGRIQFWKPDESAVVQVSNNHLSVNQIKDYPGWEDYRGSIERALAEYRKVSEPAGLRRLGLRYINHIRPPKQEFQFDEYFAFYPAVSDSLPGLSYVDFALMAHFPFDDGQRVMRVQLNDARPAEHGDTVLVLDMDYTQPSASDIAFEGLPEWLDVAHQRIKDTFEACLTDALKRTFDEEEA